MNRDEELIKLLRHRGYRTEALYSLHDVNVSLEMINENEQELEGKPHIVLSDNDRLQVLNTCFNSMMIGEVHSIINTEISNYILEHFDNPRYYKKS
jgi:G:T-mismatch repair DNA endonuclease (very short patch repair protein)